MVRCDSERASSLRYEYAYVLLAPIHNGKTYLMRSQWLTTRDEESGVEMDVVYGIDGYGSTKWM